MFEGIQDRKKGSLREILTLSVEFEEPNYGIDRYKVVITATAFVDGYPTGFKITMHGDNTSKKRIRLEVEANPLGRVVYNFFKNKIFKGGQVRNLTKGILGMFADWSIKPEELKNILNRTHNLMGQTWKEALKAEKQK